MKQQLAFTLTLALLLLGCKKEEPQVVKPAAPTSGYPNPGFNTTGCPQSISIRGFVTDSLSGIPVEGILVGPQLISGAYDISKADGSYKQTLYYNPCWHLALVKPSSFVVKVKSGQAYYSQNEYVNLVPFNNGDTVYRNLKVIPYSQLKIHISGNAGGAELSLNDFATGSTADIELGTVSDTIISRWIKPNRSMEIKLFADGELYTTIPYTSQYGLNETIQIAYP